MRFLNPVAVTCPTCGQPTVVAETSIASVRVHCGTWRWQCDIPSTTIVRVDLTPLHTASDQELAA
jgi:ribosomal protein S27AE